MFKFIRKFLKGLGNYKNPELYGDGNESESESESENVDLTDFEHETTRYPGQYKIVQDEGFFASAKSALNTFVHGVKSVWRAFVHVVKQAWDALTTPIITFVKTRVFIAGANKTIDSIPEEIASKEDKKFLKGVVEDGAMCYPEDNFWKCFLPSFAYRVVSRVTDASSAPETKKSFSPSFFN